MDFCSWCEHLLIYLCLLFFLPHNEESMLSACLSRIFMGTNLNPLWDKFLLPSEGISSFIWNLNHGRGFVYACFWLFDTLFYCLLASQWCLWAHKFVFCFFLVFNAHLCGGLSVVGGFLLREMMHMSSVRKFVYLRLNEIKQ